jgi:undecaprenyl-diphosphatase
MIDILLLGAVQIIIEALPISSSGHVMVMQRLLAWFGFARIGWEEWFDNLMHAPTLIILLIFFRREWISPLLLLVKGIFKRTASWRRLARIVLFVAATVFLADAATAVMYLVFKPWIIARGFDMRVGALLFGFSTTALLLLSTAFLHYRSPARLTYGKAVLLGFVQGLAFLPGLSRFGSTYVIARWCGLSHRRAFQYSFVLFIPLIIVALIGHCLPLFVRAMMVNDFTVQGVLNILTTKLLITSNLRIGIPIIIVGLGAGFVSYRLLKWVDWLGKIQRWYLLGWYMLLPILLTLLTKF